MMLSPQAARMGTVWTTLRNIGMSSSNSALRVTLQGHRSSIRGSRLADRFKSPAAVFSSISDEDFDDSHHDNRGKLVVDRTEGHKLAAEYRAESDVNQRHAYEEPWMMNLGRGNDNAWLMGLRKDDEWFTGVAPRNCPGKSLMLPTQLQYITSIRR